VSVYHALKTQLTAIVPADLGCV